MKFEICCVLLLGGDFNDKMVILVASGIQASNHPIRRPILFTFSFGSGTLVKGNVCSVDFVLKYNTRKFQEMEEKWNCKFFWLIDWRRWKEFLILSNEFSCFSFSCGWTIVNGFGFLCSWCVSRHRGRGRQSQHRKSSRPISSCCTSTTRSLNASTKTTLQGLPRWKSRPPRPNWCSDLTERRRRIYQMQTFRTFSEEVDLTKLIQCTPKVLLRGFKNVPSSSGFPWKYFKLLFEV